MRVTGSLRAIAGVRAVRTACVARIADLPVAHAKPHLPHKTCTVCGRPFAWRRKWARCWDEVRYCSEACRRRRSQVRTPREA
ncbi:DUF2256 domain-containing protein [Thioalkalivibrio sp. ALJ16]|uniref:DUF2256 domain-containing protein n=1 Tax=Thioalkalivibrio sp. ALJ16 TaxID=1158762 RepID=UPI0009D9FA73|nr:DUF2256 domain-containing protein [Thioalkalivibrio sp. ALJ16]